MYEKIWHFSVRSGIKAETTHLGEKIISFQEYKSTKRLTERVNEEGRVNQQFFQMFSIKFQKANYIKKKKKTN